MTLGHILQAGIKLSRRDFQIPLTLVCLTESIFIEVSVSVNALTCVFDFALCWCIPYNKNGYRLVTGNHKSI